MSNDNQALARVERAPTQLQINPKLRELAKQIDQTAGEALELFKGADGSFAIELAMAQTIANLRAMLTPEVMKPVMELMNTDLGFRCDRPNTKSPQPYSVEVIRDVLIEAKIRGFHTVGNEFNVISGRFYAAKAGLRRKVMTYPGLTDFKDGYDVPRNAAGGAVVKCSAAWKKDGIADHIDAEIAVKTDGFSGADAIVGKAERKLLKRVLDRLSGIITPDGEAGEADAPVVAEPIMTSPPPAPRRAAEHAAVPSTTTTPPASKGPEREPAEQRRDNQDATHGKGAGADAAPKDAPAVAPEAEVGGPPPSGAASDKQEPPWVEEPSDLAPILRQVSQASSLAELAGAWERIVCLAPSIERGDMMAAYGGALERAFARVSGPGPALGALSAECKRISKDLPPGVYQALTAAYKEALNRDRAPA